MDHALQKGCPSATHIVRTATHSIVFINYDVFFVITVLLRLEKKLFNLYLLWRETFINLYIS